MTQHGPHQSPPFGQGGQPNPQQGQPGWGQQQPQPGQYPQQGQGGYPQQPGAYPGGQQGGDFGSYGGGYQPSAPVSGFPVTSVPGYGQQTPPQQPKGRSRKLLWSMISLCVVLAIAFVGTAYFFFFSGDSPEEVVEKYINAVADEDIEAARELACADASDGVKFNLDAESIDASKRWFARDALTWSIRSEHVSGSNATLIGDSRLQLIHYDQPVDQRWDYKLTRESGTWKLCRIILMTIVEDGEFEVGSCAVPEGFLVKPGTCASSEELIVTLEVSNPDDCTDSTTDRLETKSNRILCLEPNPY